MSGGRLAGLVATVLLLVVAAPARGDVFAAVEVHAPGSRTDFDIEVVNAATGAQVPLPAGVNTTADELHPSISEDGSRLVFERRDSSAGTVRIIAVDLRTDQSSDLFTGLETAQDPPTSPTMSPDGQTVATGGRWQPSGSGFASVLTLTSLASFPSGPYAHETTHGFAGGTSPGQVTDVAAGGDHLYAVRAVNAGDTELIGLEGPSSESASGVSGPGPVVSFDDPALAASDPTFVLFATQNFSPFSASGDIQFLPIGPDPSDSGFELPSSTLTRLPAVVNTPQVESQPAVTAEGRFIAFVRHGTDRHDRLFLWDSQTQLLVNPSGVDLGAIDSSKVGSVGVYTQPVFSIAQVSLSRVSQVALANVATRQGSGLGILVQRIVGHHRILGRREYKLRPVGRVPLGFFKKGHHRLHWNLRVNGRRLHRGRYLVTLRAVTRQGVVHDLAKPDVIRIH